MKATMQRLLKTTFFTLCSMALLTLGSSAFAKDAGANMPCGLGGSCASGKTPVQPTSEPGLKWDPATIPLQGDKQNPIAAAKNVQDAILAQTYFQAKQQFDRQNVLPPSLASTSHHGFALSVTAPALASVHNLVANSWLNYYLGNTTLNQADLTARVPLEYLNSNYPLLQKDSSAAAVTKQLQNSFIITRAKQGFCGKLERTTGIAQLTKDCVESSNSGQDLNALSLFDPAISNVQAALRYIQNISGVLPQALPDGLKNATTIQEAAPFLESLYATNAERSLVQNALLSIYFNHAKADTLTRPVHFNPTAAANDKPQAVEPTSEFGLLQYEAGKRFKTPEWYDTLQSMPQDAVLKEIALMQATQLELLFKMYEQNQYQLAVTAMQAHNLAELVNGAQATISTAESEAQPKALMQKTIDILRNQNSPEAQKMADQLQKMQQQQPDSGSSAAGDGGQSGVNPAMCAQIKDKKLREECEKASK